MSLQAKRREDAALPLWQLYPVFFAAVYLSHLTLLRLPYFWDEAGYYIPAAWDFYRAGTLIPISTAANAHPPLPSILLAAWWHICGFAPTCTRTLVCMVSAAALLAVYRMARGLAGTYAAAAATILTGLYPVWFAQSTLAHADIFSTAFVLWGMALYVESLAPSTTQGKQPNRPSITISATISFSLAALAKETALIIPFTLAAWEAVLSLRERHTRNKQLAAGIAPEGRAHLRWIGALLFPVLPLAAWYAYCYHRTGYAFGDPGFLRYNATNNLSALRIALALYHRLLHLTLHMNMFVPVACAAAAWFAPAIAGRARIPRIVVETIAVLLLANWITYSVLGGALLTRYLLPMYPLVLLLCVAEWQLHFRSWAWPAALSAAAFLAGLWINPPYAFAPEDNLAYRDYVVLHQGATAYIAQHFPQGTVLTAWPGTNELSRPELGYVKHSLKVYTISNFTLDEVAKAAANPGEYDTALVFSTKLVPSIRLPLQNGSSAVDRRYFEFHDDLRPHEIAAMLHGDVVWQAEDHGEWAAVLRFPRVANASLRMP